MTARTDDRDVVDILTQDHHDVLDLLASIPRLPVDEQRDVVDTVIAELVRHSVAEEMYVYPAIRRHLPDGDAEVAQDVQEHQELEQTMKALEAVASPEPGFAELVAELDRQLRHHARQEEQQQFPRLRATLPRQDLLDLGVKVETAKQIAPTRPHPAAPHSELFHKAFGPGVGLVDKLRDAVTGRARNT